MERRLCRISITQDIIERQPEVVVQALASLQLIAIDVDFRWINDDPNVLNYVFYSPLLPVVEKGKIIPTRNIIIHYAHDETRFELSPENPTQRTTNETIQVTPLGTNTPR